MLSADERRALIKYKIEKARRSLAEAEGVITIGLWNLAGNRLYYSAFHMASALLLDKGLTARSHAGVIHLLGEKFISTGLLDKSYGRFFSRLYELRQSGDYDDMFDATEEEVRPYIEKTRTFMKDMESIITFK